VLFQDGHVLLDVELVGLPRSWEPFLQGICAREMFPGFDRIWIDCIQEETQLMSRMIWMDWCFLCPDDLASDQQ
jgi:hypothetical protein